MDKVAVIIPTYKPKEYIRECIKSIGNQTCDLTKLEVIVVLNGEKDPYYSFLELELEKYAFKHTLIHLDKTGVSYARNVGLEKAENLNIPYILFIDDDDLISPSFIEDSLNKIQKDTIVIGKTLCFNNNIQEGIQEDYLTRKFEQCKEQPYNIVKYRSFLSNICGKLIPLEIVKGKRFNPKYQIGEDSLFGFEISSRIKKMILANDDSIYYRRLRDDSASRKKQSKIKLLKNNTSLCFAYTRIYFKNIGKINFRFYLTRILASFRNVIKN